MTELTPQHSFETILRRWWLITLLAVLGGGLGWLFHLLRPPVYEAQATFHISIDYRQAPELTEFEDDQAVAGAAAIIVSTEVMEETASEAQSTGIDVTLEDLERIGRIERRQAQWLLFVRDADPHTAMTLANLWAKRAAAAVMEADQYAKQANALQAYANLLQACNQTQEPPEHLVPQCQHLEEEGIGAELQVTYDALGQARAGSRGLFSALLFDLSERALLPTEPVRYGQNSLVLAGAALGLLIGLWFALTGWPLREVV